LRLIASVASPSAEAMVAGALASLASGADLAELRLDALAEGQLEAMWLAAPVISRVPWIATLRSADEGGACRRDPRSRREILLAAARAGAGFLDLELRDAVSGDWTTGAAARVGLIASHHNLAGLPANVGELLMQLDALRGRCPGAAKLAWACNEASEGLLALDLMRAAPGERIAIAMGEKGIVSRVLARKGQGFGTFCTASIGSATAPGQVGLSAMLTEYRWRDQSDATQLFGVLGNPVNHSLSPAIFNAQFRSAGLNALYLPVRLESEGELANWIDGCRRRPWLNTGGFSVTVPHKRAVLQHADRGVDPLARRIGAANTLRVSANGVTAHNTDCAGALAALESGLGYTPDRLRGAQATVLGAGGVARAIVAGLVGVGAHVVIYNRSADRARDLASEFDCRAGDWDVRHRHSGELLVNCTSVGMTPLAEDTPMPAEGLRPDLAVFDTVYNPRETMLLKLARKAGCRTLDGVAMFVAQAAAQYRIWTNSTADVAEFTRIVTDRLAV